MTTSSVTSGAARHYGVLPQRRDLFYGNAWHVPHGGYAPLGSVSEKLDAAKAIRSINAIRACACTSMTIATLIPQTIDPGSRTRRLRSPVQHQASRRSDERRTRALSDLATLCGSGSSEPPKHS